MQLSREEINLWFCFYKDIRDPNLLNEYRLLLSESEHCQEQRFHFENDRHRYLITRALVRTILSRYAPVPPSQWTFSNNVYGKPEIASDNQAATSISFNVSHTEGLILLGVTAKAALGVDVENFRARKFSLAIADSFFSSEEIHSLNSVPIAAQQEHFFEFWTLKESYIKARGMGLSIPLDHFSFRLQGNHISLSIHPKLNDDFAHWHFWQLRTGSDYLTSVCAERFGCERRALVCKKIVPLCREEIFHPNLMRESLQCSKQL